MNLYHLTYTTDREALQWLAAHRDVIHAAGGYGWTSLSHGTGPAYVVVAFTPGVEPPFLNEHSPAAFTSDLKALRVLDPEGPLTPVVVPVVAEEEEPDEQSETGTW